ncbi:hypothetical protein KWI12_11180, partial [Citrobacter cronae]|uniref:hypothetical protein n=1 Tax=Citrobacter cronae TaxID=1748967 RepID=UPI0021CE5325
GSVGSPHARVGNCQASNKVKKPVLPDGLFCVCGEHSRCDLDVGLISAAHQAHCGTVVIFLSIA